MGIGTSSPVTTLTASNTTQNDAIGIAQVVNTTANDLSSSTLTVKNHSGTGQFMEWRTFGMRIGSRIITNNGVGDVTFTHGNDVEKMRLTATGLGIGTSSPSVPLEISNTYPVIRLTDSDGTAPYAQIINSAGILQLRADDGNSTNNSSMQFWVDGSERMRINASGKLTYGGVSYGVAVDPDGSGGFGSGYNFETNAGSPRHLVTGPVSGQYLSSGSSPFVAWYTGASAGAGTAAPERIRIDSSGNLLVGTTAETNWETVAGFRTRQSGSTTITRASAPALYVNRITNDGGLVEFRRGTAVVGSIRSISGDSIGIGNGDAGLRFVSGTNRIQPVDMDNGLNSDALTSLGDTNKRFKDLYLSSGVYLGGTGAANKLDDYEEGTWTPTGAGVTLGSALGTYTKVGRVVTVNWLFAYPTTSSGSQTYIANLPFSAGTSYTNGGSHGYVNGSAAVSTSHITSTSTSLLFRTPNGGVLLTHADFSGAIVRGTYTYQTS